MVRGASGTPLQMHALTVGMVAENPEKSSDRHPDPQLESEQLRSAARGLAMAGTVMAGSILTGLGIGYVIDQWAGTSPKWTIGLLIFFIVGGIYNLVREARKP
jgi:ATP synthase protein I